MNNILKELELHARENKVPIILEGSRDVLEVLLLTTKPQSILEIGTAIGYSSIFMAQVLGKEIKIDTIEINADMVEKAWHNIENAGLQNVIRIIEGDALEILPLLTKEYDFVFMDAAKSKYIDFLPHCVRLVKKDGIIFSDNVLYKGMTNGPELVKHKQRTAVTGLRNFLTELENHPDLKTVVLDIGDGVTVSVKK
ncbi:MAG: O-methyltransferase [Deltaproteobacteria bacterium]